ncbi:15153_t:CDS:2, partial [Acaulospora colombiana]
NISEYLILHRHHLKSLSRVILMTPQDPPALLQLASHGYQDSRIGGGLNAVTNHSSPRLSLRSPAKSVPVEEKASFCPDSDGVVEVEHKETIVERSSSARFRSHLRADNKSSPPIDDDILRQKIASNHLNGQPPWVASSGLSTRKTKKMQLQRLSLHVFILGRSFQRSVKACKARQNTSEDNREFSKIKARLDAMMQRQRESRQAYRARKTELSQSRSNIVGDGNTRSGPHTRVNGQYGVEQYLGKSMNEDTNKDEENGDDEDIDEDMIDQAEGAVPEVVDSDTEMQDSSPNRERRRKSQNGPRQSSSAAR